jgi:hypothetical protein
MDRPAQPAVSGSLQRQANSPYLNSVPFMFFPARREYRGEAIPASRPGVAGPGQRPARGCLFTRFLPIFDQGRESGFFKEGGEVESKRKLLLIIAVIGMIGTFLPWARWGPFTVSGTKGDGWFTFVFFGIAAALCLFKGDKSEALTKGGTTTVTAMGILGFLFGLWKIIRFGDVSETGMTLGIGLWVIVLAGAAIVYFNVFAKKKEGAAVAPPASAPPPPPPPPPPRDEPVIAPAPPQAAPAPPVDEPEEEEDREF